MGTWPTPIIEPLVTIHPYSLESCGIDMVSQAVYLNAAASAVWPAANYAVFIPFILTKQITVLEMFVFNGATVSSSFDLGVYSVNGTLIFSTGATAQSTASAIQVCSVSSATINTIGPGSFYMAMSCSTIVATYYQSTFSVNKGAILGIAAVASAYPLPVSTTLATCTTGYVPLIGLSTRTVV